MLGDCLRVGTWRVLLVRWREVVGMISPVIGWHRVLISFLVVFSLLFLVQGVLIWLLVRPELRIVDRIHVGIVVVRVVSLISFGR